MSNDKITINDVAEALGISKTTVSRAISGKGRISEETTKRVMDFINEHNYKPSLLAKGLANQRTYNVAVVWPMDYDFVELPFLQQAMIGMSEVLKEYDNDILICMVKGSNIDQLDRIVKNNKVDGVILTRTMVKDAAAQYLKKSGIPFVAIGSSEDKKVITIDDDNYTACKELTKILAGKGLGKIALLGGSKDVAITNTRFKGYSDALKESESELDESIVYYDVDSEQKVLGILDDLRNKSVKIAICMDDSICASVLSVCRSSGIRIPDQLKLASFYDSKFLSNATPAVTSLSFDDRQLGREAATLMMDLIEGREVSKRTISTYEIILKESTK